MSWSSKHGSIRGVTSLLLHQWRFSCFWSRERGLDWLSRRQGCWIGGERQREGVGNSGVSERAEEKEREIVEVFHHTTVTVSSAFSIPPPMRIRSSSSLPTHIPSRPTLSHSLTPFGPLTQHQKLNPLLFAFPLTHLSLTLVNHPHPPPLLHGFFPVHPLIGDAALWRDSLCTLVLAPRYWIKLIIWFPHKLWASRARSCATIVCTIGGQGASHPHSGSISTSEAASSSLLSNSSDDGGI